MKTEIDVGQQRRPGIEYVSGAVSNTFPEEVEKTIPPPRIPPFTTIPPFTGYANQEKKTILKRADALINGQRANDYGQVTENFTRIAKIWSEIAGVALSTEQVALMMIGMKMARLIDNTSHEDSWLDIAGYVGCWEKVKNGE